MPVLFTLKMLSISNFLPAPGPVAVTAYQGRHCCLLQEHVGVCGLCPKLDPSSSPSHAEIYHCHHAMAPTLTAITWERGSYIPASPPCCSATGEMSVGVSAAPARPIWEGQDRDLGAGRRGQGSRWVLVGVGASTTGCPGLGMESDRTRRRWQRGWRGKGLAGDLCALQTHFSMSGKITSMEFCQFRPI